MNKFTGGVTIEGGKLTVASLANTDGTEYGALGGVDNTITLNGGTLATTDNVVSNHQLTIGQQGGTVNVALGKTLTANGAISQTAKTSMEKNGKGILTLGGTVKLGTLYLNEGTLRGSEVKDIHQYPDTVVFNGGAMKDPDNIYSYSSNKVVVVVPEERLALGRSTPAATIRESY